MLRTPLFLGVKPCYYPTNHLSYRVNSIQGVSSCSVATYQARLLLLHLLLAALIAEDFQLGAPQFEALRAALKLPPQELVTCYRCLCAILQPMRSTPVCSR